MFSLYLYVLVFMVTTVIFFHSVSQEIVFGMNTNNAVQILLSGDIQSWNVLHPVLLLFLPFCEWRPLPSQCSGSSGKAFFTSPLTPSCV